MAKMAIILLLLLMPFLLPARGMGASLNIDGFRIYSSGTVNLTNNGGNGSVKAVAVQPWDGKVIIGGIFTATAGSPVKTLLNLARLNTDGTLDTGFFPIVDGQVNAVVVQMDKSDPPQPLGILVGGSFTKITDGGGDHFRKGLARLKIDGSVDDTFDPATDGGTVIQVITLHPTANSILVGGTFSDIKGRPGGTSCSNIARIAGSDGTFQDCYAGGVSVGITQAVNAILVQEDGKVVVGGDFQSPQPYLVRFHDTGLVDTSFTPRPGGVVRSLAIQADWSILAGGDFTWITTSNFPAGIDRHHLARMTNDGVLDGFDPGPDGAVSAMVVQPDGKIVLAGSFVKVLDEDGTVTSRHRVARYQVDGSLDDFDPDALGRDEVTPQVTGEVAVEALTLQSDEKLLIGGRFAAAAGRPRTMLARFYGFGTLDDDVANVGSTVDYHIGDVVLEPDGQMAFWGDFSTVWGQTLKGLAKLNPDWTLADAPAFNDSASMPDGSSSWLIWSPLIDDKYTLIAGSGIAMIQNALCSHSWLFLNDSPLLDFGIPYNAQRFADVPHEYAEANTTSAAAEAPDGLIYLAGVNYPNLVDAYNPATWGTPYFLSKLDRNGVWDRTFDAPSELMWPPTSPLMQPSLLPNIRPVATSMLIDPGPTKDDYKIIVGTKYGSIFRLNKDGTLDPTFNVLRPEMIYDSNVPDWDPSYRPTYQPFEQVVSSLTFDKDGQIVAAGNFDYTYSKDGKIWHRNVMRINHHRPGYQDGTIDDRFTVEVGLDPGWVYTYNQPNISHVSAATVQVDGSVLVAGWFDHLVDADGNTVPVNNVARIDPTGHVDPGINFGIFGEPVLDSYQDNYQVSFARLQPDGKGIITGQYDRVNGDFSKARIVRFAAGWATQELSVAADGSKVTWTRGIEEPDTTLCGLKVCGGGGPELKRAVFLYSEDGTTWEMLGEAVRTAPTKWELGGLNLGRDKGWNQIRYIRARGLMAGDNGGGKLIETSKAYYLRAQVTVKAQLQSIPAGSTPTFTPQYFYADGTGRALIPVAASLRGAPVFTTTATTSSPPGDYTVTADLQNLSSWMYSFVAADSTLTLTAATSVINVIAAPQSKTYGSTDPTLTYTFSPPLPNGVTVSGTLTRDGGETVAGGPYAIRQGTLALSGGYSINFTGNTLRIDPKPVTVTVTEKSKGYGDTDPALTYTVNPSLVGADSFTGSLGRVAGETVAGGPYAIQQGTLALNANYTVTFSPATLTITPKAVTVTAAAKSKSYGDPDPALTYTVNPSLIGTDSFSGSLSRSSGETVAGSPYAIQQGTLSLSSNYTLVYLPANLTISSKVVTVTAQAKSKVYGNSDPPLTYTCAPALVGSDTFVGALMRAPGESVAGGPYPIQQGTLSAGSNYAISFTGASLTITKAAASVTPGTATKVYGDPDPPLTGTLSGFLPADNITASFTRTAGETVAGGPYPVVALLSPEAVLSNYSITYNPANLTITKRNVTIAASDAGKTYGQSDPTLASSASGLLAADLGPGRITLSASRSPGENVQSYDITPTASDNGTTLLANYTPQFLHGTFTISKALLTITADNQSRPYGSPNPTLTVQYAGLASFDTVASLGGGPLVTTTATQSSPKGSYPISVAQGSMTSPNYSYAFVSGLLTVSAASQSISFNALRPKTYGDADFDPGASASSGLPVSYASSLTGVAAVVGSKIRVAAPGSTEITASQGGDGSYLAAAEVVRTLVVNPPPGNCLYFDGVDDLVRIKDAPQLNFGGKPGFTIETWLHLNGSQLEGAGLLSKGGVQAGQGAGGYQLVLHEDRIGAEISDGTYTIGVAQGLAGTTSLNDDAWHHVALSVDRAAATATLYLDGRVEATVSDPALGMSPDSPDDLLIGVDRGGARFFRGQIDELRLWDVARGQDEIRNNLSQIIDPLNEAHLTAYYHFDEGDAGGDNAPFTTAPDRTGNGGDGTLQRVALTGATSNWVRSGAFLPLLETEPVSAVTSVSAIGGGLVYPGYYPATDAGLCWGSSANPGVSENCVHNEGGAGPFIAAVTGLTPGAAYHVRAFAVNRMGTAYGNDVILQAAKLDQTITAEAISDRTYGDPAFALSVGASSGLPVAYASSNPAVATLNNGSIRINGAGSTLITLSQPGNATFNPAPVVTIPMNVLKAPLTVTADNKARAYQTTNPPLTASYAGFVNGDGVEVVEGGPVLTTASSQSSPVGSYPIVVDTAAMAAANYRFLPVNGTLTVYRSCQLIIFPPLADKTFGDPPFSVSASSCSGLGISFTSSNPQVALVVGNVVTVTGAGSAFITASQTGSDSVEQAPAVSQLLVIHRSGQSVNFPPLPRKVLGEAPFTLAATASSALAVSYRSSDLSVATVSGNTVTILRAGTTVITASQAGNNNYEAALPASQPLTAVVEGEPPTLSLSTLSVGAVTADPVFNLTGSATDASGIASLTVNGVDLTDRAAFFSSAIPLLAGDNNITVAVRDGAGNTASETVTVTFDSTVPVIALSSPADNSVTNASLIPVAGSVPPGCAVTMAVNAGAPQNLPVAGGTFSGTAGLEPGLNTIELAATLQGQVSRVKRSVTFAPGLPSVAIEEPGEDLQSDQESLMIRGSSNMQGSGLAVTIDADGTLFTSDLLQGSFQQRIPLNRGGVTHVSAIVTDGSGNTSVAYRNIVSSPKPWGDLNGDGRVDLTDAMLALRLSIGLDPLTVDALARADVAPLVNGVPQPDGMLDVGDVVVILRKVVGLVDF